MNHLKLFEEYLLENGKGRRTVEEYRNAVLSLEKWYNGRSEHSFEPDSVTARDLHDWVAYMQTVDRLAPATINKRIASVKVYWSFLTQAGYSNLEPTKKIKMKRISNLDQLPRWMSRKEQDKLLHTVAEEKNQWKRMRDMAIVQTMLQSGLRTSEVMALDVQDVDFRRKTLTVISGKGRKHRVALINLDLLKALDVWMNTRGEVTGEALFLSERGNTRMTRQGVHYLVRKYLNKVGLNSYSSHALRHSFCRNLIDANQPLQVIAQLAGHESMETTRRYVTPSELDLRRAVERVSLCPPFCILLKISSKLPGYATPSREYG